VVVEVVAVVVVVVVVVAAAAAAVVVKHLSSDVHGRRKMSTLHRGCVKKLIQEQ